MSEHGSRGARAHDTSAATRLPVAHLPTPMVPSQSTVLTVIADLVGTARALGVDDSVIIDPVRAVARLDPPAVIAASPFRFAYGRRRDLELAVDHVAGATVRRRPFTERLWRSAVAEIELPPIEGLVIHDASFGHAADRVARRLSSSPCWLYSHTPVSRSVGTRELRGLVDRLTGVICVSEAMRSQLMKRLGRSSDKVHVVHNGVDSRLFHPGESPPSERPPVVLAAGLQTPQKGIDCLLRSTSLLRTGGWRLDLAGGDWYTAGRAIVADSDDQIVRHGFLPREEMPDFLRSGRVFVFPSAWDEPFGLGLLEAMASGLACVTTKRGGLPEVGGDAVVYVEPNDPTALARAIDELLADDQLADELGTRARARALLFSTQQQFERFDQLVSRLRAPPGARSA